MSRRLGWLGSAVLYCAPLAVGAPYWVAYEGNDFPENEGWERNFGDENGVGNGGAERSLSSGVLSLNSMRNHLIYDTYRFSGQISPEADERFIAEWRLMVVDATGPLAEVGITIARDSGGTLGFRYRTDTIESPLEGWNYPIAPGFHDFRLESSDMLSYSLWMDGALIRNGYWLDNLNESYFAFGDSGYGGTVLSHAEWDYVRFGVVPEPGTVWCLVSGCVVLMRRTL